MLWQRLVWRVGHAGKSPNGVLCSWSPSAGFQHVNKIIIIGPNDGNIVEVTPPMDTDHFNLTSNPVDFHYTKSYMAQLNGLDGAASGTSSSALQTPHTLNERACKQTREVAFV